MLTLVDRAAHRAVAQSPWTPVYGLARTLLAVATLATLVVNPVDVLFVPITAGATVDPCAGVNAVGLFCLAGDEGRAVARWLAIAVLAVVASGWRPRWTAVAHWWVAFSTHSAVTLVDGGDQVTAVLTLLLLPVALLDVRRWHWSAVVPAVDGAVEPVRRVVGHSALVVIRFQVAFVYFHAAVAKFGVAEWANGTALYYWIRNPTAGAPPAVADLLAPVLAHGALVAAVTWGVLALELALGLAPLLPRELRRLLLVGGLMLHLGIALLLGLPTFSLAMVAALVLLLVDVEQPLTLRRRATAQEPAAAAASAAARAALAEPA